MSHSNCVSMPFCGIDFKFDTSALPVLSREEIQEMIDNAIGNLAGGGSRTLYESEWTSLAVSGSYTFQHNLALEHPENTQPVLAFRVKTPTSGFSAGEILFLDGCNNVGATPSNEVGWVTSVGRDTLTTAFGNNENIGSCSKTGGFGTISKSAIEFKVYLKG